MRRRDVITSVTASVLAGFTAWPAQAQRQKNSNLVGYLRTNWSRDPFSYGSYSHLARGAWQRHHRHLAAPIANTLYFAGEAVHPDRNSSVHAALESGRQVAAKLLNHNHQRIGIIGAGIAGISAAHILDASGREVEIIEARNRIGGRINTDRSLGFAADLGASWLHGADGNPLTDEINQAGMRRVVSLQESVAVRRNGTLLEQNDLPDWFEDISIYNNHAGTGVGTINTWGYLFESDYSGDEYLFPDGYDQIFPNFAGNYAVSLQEIVSEINYNEEGVTVVSSRGRSAFDAVIVTVPLGVLKSGDIEFTPALPDRHQNAISTLGFGTLDKVYLQFEDVFWDRDAQFLITPFNNLPPGQFNSWVNLYPISGIPVVQAFNGGPTAIELSSISDKVVVQKALNTILSAYGLNAYGLNS